MAAPVQANKSVFSVESLERENLKLIAETLENWENISIKKLKELDPNSLDAKIFEKHQQICKLMHQDVSKEIQSESSKSPYININYVARDPTAKIQACSRIGMNLSNSYIHICLGSLVTHPDNLVTTTNKRTERKTAYAATSLIQAIFLKALEQGVPYILVAPPSYAEPIYEKWGFKKIVGEQRMQITLREIRQILSKEPFISLAKTPSNPLS